MIFRDLSKNEVIDFENYAWCNDPDPRQWGIYHPVCRRIWVQRGLCPPDEAHNPTSDIALEWLNDQMAKWLNG